jgi:flavin reductase (DIM6/NTAB) family NADH-FMN oxidoreductase RutF
MEEQMKSFKSISIDDFTVNPFSLPSKEWFLITAEKPDGKINTLTAAYGGFGHIWQKKVIFGCVRSSRYTKEFLDVAEKMSFCILPKEYRNALNYLGTVSGRDEDKIAKSGLTVLHDEKVPFFAESNLVFIARKIYVQEFAEDSFIDKNIIEKIYHGIYHNDGFHNIYIAEIEKIMVPQ